jgi:hypothetical protein
MAIQGMWPEAFVHGKCRSRFFGSIHRPLEMKFQLVNEEDSRTFNLNQVPEILLEWQIGKQIQMANDRDKAMWKSIMDRIRNAKKIKEESKWLKR